MMNEVRRYRPVALSIFWIAVHVGTSYAVYAVRAQPEWIQTIASTAQVGTLLLAFFALIKSRGLYANLLRGLLVAGGLFFSSLLVLYGHLRSFPVSLWYVEMPHWGGWLVALAVVSWLPVRALSPRPLARQGWQSEWFVWTSSALALLALLGITYGGQVWIAHAVARIGSAATATANIANEVSAVRATVGLLARAAALLYVRLMPRLLRRRILLWLVLLVLGAALIALPVIVEDEGLPMAFRRLANRVLYNWHSAPFIGCAVFFSAILGLWPRRVRTEQQIAEG